jgi:polysaccharide biosynthesis protein PslH
LRILQVVHEPPLPPYNGQRLVLASLLPHLRGEHEVRVVSLDGPREGRAPAWLRLVPIQADPLADLSNYGRFVRGRPLRADGLARSLLPRVTEELHDFDPDVVHVCSSQLASLRPAIATRPALLTALDAGDRNIEARAAMRRGPAKIALRRQARNQRRFVAAEYPRYSAVVMVTPEDAEAVRTLAPTADVHVIPNGVAAAHFSSEPANRTGHRIVLHGAMNYAPNVDAALFAAREVLPRVRAAEPAAELFLVGRSPSPQVLALADLPGVTVIGEVDDVVPWLASASAYLCPMRLGTGIKNKLLEAMAAEVDQDLLVGRDAPELADHLVTVLRDRLFATSLGESGRVFVSRQHSWENAAGAYTALYAEIATG